MKIDDDDNNLSFMGEMEKDEDIELSLKDVKEISQID
jgi:hypothetical protein